jgi:hypothetical protein
MALPPGYLQLFAASRETRVPLTIEQCIALENNMRDVGWVIAPAWAVDLTSRPVGVVVEESSCSDG